MFEQAADFLEPVKALHRRIRDTVIQETERQSVEALSAVHRDEEGDTIFAVDRVSEAVLVEGICREIAPHTSVVLIAEGLEPHGMRIFPEGTGESDACWRMIVDPIDGTRGLMFQKRSAWILTGIAPNRDSGTCLADIECAVQTEIPLVNQHRSDCLWAVRGQGAHGERRDRIREQTIPFDPAPSTATTLENGFATVARYFPGFQERLGAVYDDWMERLLGPPVSGKAQCFEDQYISSGGQLAELMIGHDRVVADLRPLLDGSLRKQTERLGLCSHPYDLCTELIAREAGVVVGDEQGLPLKAPLDLHTDVSWVGVANRSLAATILPALRETLQERGFVPPL